MEADGTELPLSCTLTVSALVTGVEKVSRRGFQGVTDAPDIIEASSLTNGISQEWIWLALLLALEATLVFNCTVVLQDSF